MIELGGVARHHWMTTVEDGFRLEEPEIWVMYPEGGQLKTY